MSELTETGLIEPGQCAIVWFRNDLRLHDHEPLHRALHSHARVIPLYCFDPRQFVETSWGFPKTGAIRAQFLIESVMDLRTNLRSRGSDLVVRLGLPEEIIPQLALEVGASAVYYHEEVTAEEVWVENALKRRLIRLGTLVPWQIETRSFWGHTLMHLDDLPFAIAALPELFSNFRKQVEAAAIARPLFPTPRSLDELPDIPTGNIPELSDLGLASPEFEPRGVLHFVGGETTGWARLDDYFWKRDRLRHYKETRNGMLGDGYSSKFSPWLAAGCLSPRAVVAQVREYERIRTANDSTYWLVFELLWRDYLRFVAAKHGANIFHPSGLLGIPIPWKQNWTQFQSWKEGKTGFPLVDANMRELAATGFMSNRGRQNVASFLTKNLGIDWRMGAAWFESQLIDYDVTSNWGNWNYAAGVGNDARGFRFFNILKQAREYDSRGDYVRLWLPELQHLTPEEIHEPWKFPSTIDYPSPIVDLVASAARQREIYQAAIAAHGRLGAPPPTPNY